MGKFSYVGTGIEDNINIVPYAQILNPIKHTSVGIGIKKDQAELAGFKPNKSWELKSLLIGEEEQEVYVSSSPRLILLSRSEILMIRDSEIIKYDPVKKDEGFKALSYFVMLFLDDSNNALSDMPFRVKTSSMAGKSLRTSYTKWQGQLLSAYKACEGSTEGLTWSAGVFSPVFIKGQTIAPDGKKINISEVDSFVAISPDNIEKNFILPDSKLGRQLPVLKETVKNWCDLAKVKSEYQKIEEEILIDRASLLSEIADKFNQLNYSKEEKDNFVDGNFDASSLSELTDEQLITASSLLDAEMAQQSVPF
jgi:hypothetical protein